MRLVGSGSGWKASGVGEGEGAGKRGLKVGFIERKLVAVGMGAGCLRGERWQTRYPATATKARMLMKVRALTFDRSIRFDG
jgi:hypothetical protein